MAKRGSDSVLADNHLRGFENHSPGLITFLAWFGLKRVGIAAAFVAGAFGSWIVLC
jgi:hypothetical protein